METMHIITQSDPGETFYVSTKDGAKDFVGNAYLHLSGALLVQPKDGKSIYLGPGQWESLSMGERDKTAPQAWVM